MSITRTEYTIEVTNVDDGSKTALIPMYGGDLLLTQQRLDDLNATPFEPGVDRVQTYRLVKREVTITEWEPA